MRRQRWAVLVHDLDGYVSEGYVVGPFHGPEAAKKKAAQIERAAEARTYAPSVECIVLSVLPGSRGANAIVDELS